ncbi:DUF805 domain-containing protein [Hymenobacter fodinae]|uniref:DUF805 domain-containing protein n=1 Tax=Hymenobacter fodinae TaxID=2510796 RepID=A0A4Z0PAU9_9BACT|nr:DUF805 domain-containing protein [Hymenobacter fodinae]TGE09694.1 DUF805 domain-containing protein [Hymenobacter fodinae]
MIDLFTTRGRLRRRAYWYRSLMIYGIVVLVYALASQVKYTNANDELLAAAGVGLVIFVGLILANIQVIKRLHDTNLSGWWWLLFLVPIVSYGLSIGMTFVQGTRGRNRFGPDPKRPWVQPEEVEGEHEKPFRR